MKRRLSFFAPILLLLAFANPMFAQEDKIKALEESLAKANSAIAATQASVAASTVNADTLWVMITGMLVFFMNLGFACVESGFCRAKNCVNILSKNFVVFAATSIGFWLIGWGIMFGNGNDWIGKQGLFMVGGPDNSPLKGNLGDTIKGLLKDDEKFKIDLTDEKVAGEAKYAKLLDEINAIYQDPKIEELPKKDEKGQVVKNDKGEVIKEKKIVVKLDVPGKGAFETTIAPDTAYWGAYSALNWTGVPMWAKFFFQLVFAGTAATIVSGAVAERIKYHSFIVFSFIMAIFIYPVVGHWVWGGGYLQANGFLDFAGSTQVHSIGGWAALAGIIILGPRIGKYGPNGKVNAIPGHNLTAATIGCFVLWFGWFGFNPGSTMAADGAAIAEVAITTNLAAAAATLTATITAWLLMGKPDLGMTLNGCLAGLVAITAPCAFVTPLVSVLIGAIAGVIVVLAVIMFDRLKLDDPVGATSVHLVNGVFGTLCIGLFATPDRLARAGNPKAVAGLFYHPEGSAQQLIMQLTGVVMCAAYVFLAALVAWVVLKVTMGIRVPEHEEIQGLDIGEHGNEAYHGFQFAAEAGVSFEPRPASVPPGADKRFEVVLEGVNNGELMHAWSDLCTPKSTDNPSFKEVYSCMTTVEGNTFTFKGGDPAKMKVALETLFKGRLKTFTKALVK